MKKNINEILSEKTKEYPIWYYKVLKEVDLDYVSWNLLLEPFVVDIQGIKYEFVFGKNEKHELIRSIRMDDLHKNPWLSAELTNKAFREGIWHSVTKENTSEIYREVYRKRKELNELKAFNEFMKSILKDTEADG